MTLTQDIKDKLSRLNVLEKIIIINVVIFVLGLLLQLTQGTFKQSSLSWLELQSDFFTFIAEPWTIISYAFVHYDFLHILFNMLWLYIIGQLFLNLFNPKLALNVYFLGAICGGLLFIASYSLFPQIFATGNRLVGASASIRALLIFLCAYFPSKEIRFFTFNLKLWYFGLAIVILDTIGLFGTNSGGNVAHLGGAALGYFYAIQLKKGHDIGKGFERMMDWVVGLFKKSKKSPLKTVHKNKSKVGGYTKSDFNEFNHQKKIDVILDKISKSGYDSLNAEEKEFLFKSGK
tara:strand:- start:12207 stop:13076 length:870 start_codon:yes stop_codon:yes gene_type:complete